MVLSGISRRLIKEKREEQIFNKSIGLSLFLVIDVLVIVLFVSFFFHTKEIERILHIYFILTELNDVN